MDIVLFNYIIEHLARILRIIKTPKGSTLLIGISGSEKKSLTKLTVFAVGYETFEITLTSSNIWKELREDLHQFNTLTGVEREQVVFLFADSHVVNESFLKYVNNILTSGVIPALLESNEKEQFMVSVREKVFACGQLDTPDNCWRAFINKCRNNIYICLCFPHVVMT